MSDCCEPNARARQRALWRTIWIVGGVIALVLASTCLKSQEPALYLEGGFGHKQGDFGTPILSKLNMAYGTVGYASSTFDLNVTVPVLRLESQGPGVNYSADGLGDVLIRGVHRFVPETSGGFSFDGGLAVKLPTADSNKGLGTGQMDVGGYLATHQRWDRIQANLLGGWIQNGTTNEMTAAGASSGIYTAGIGISYYADTARYSMSYEARGALYAGTPAPREITLDVFKMLSPRFAMKAAVIAGLNDGTPRTNVGLGFVYWP